MKFIIRVALSLLLAVLLFFACIQIVIIAVAFLIWPGGGAGETVPGSFQIFVLLVSAIFFILTLLLIGWYLGKPIYFTLVWIRRLTSGRYEIPEKWETIHTRTKDKLKMPYAVYKELFEHLQTLATTLQKNEQQLKHAEETKQEWIRGISHDLKTPLTYISGYSTMLLSKQYVWSEAEKHDFLAIIQQKAAHLQELVLDLNETIDGQIPLKAERVDLIELVRRIVADVSGAPWADGRNFIMEVKPEHIEGVCDPKLLTRAIRNLLVNAVVHNPEGTSIVVSITLLDDQTTQIQIADDGVGFEQVSARNDESSTASTGRSGLGLSIASQLLSAHGSSLIVDSRPQEGTTLTIHLPPSFDPPAAT